MFSYLKKKFSPNSGVPSRGPTSKKANMIMLIIDPQMDFHPPNGTLGVPGAQEDSERTAAFIREHIDEIDDIFVTLDSHHRMHIAHGPFWSNENGEHPTPFTLITHKDIQDGKWFTTDPAHREYSLKYTKALEDKGRFVLCIWPEHCLIGTPGHSVHPSINAALQEWAGRKLDAVNYVHKGMNCLTEMYSAVLADVPIPEDPSTHLNTSLLAQLHNANKLVVCGQALSHCVNFTMRDILDNWRNDPSSIYLLQDASSNVPTFESAGEEFVRDMSERGVSIVNCADMSPRREGSRQGSRPSSKK